MRSGLCGNKAVAVEVADNILVQVDEAVAVLQAHQAKEAAQKTVTNSAAVPSV